MYPALVTGSQAPGGNNTVKMWVKQQVLPPRVENTEKADLSSQVFRVFGDFDHRCRAAPEQEIVQDRLVALAEWNQFVRKREHDMEIRHTENVLLTSGEPPPARLRLALGAVAVTAGIIGDGLMAAPGTRIDMTAQCRCPATGNGPQDSQMLVAQPSLIPIYETVIVRANDIGRLHGRPAHSGLKGLPGRCTSAVLERRIRSNGFGAAWRCFCERCRYTAVCVRSA